VLVLTLGDIRLTPGADEYPPLVLPSVSPYFPPAVAKVYIVSFRSNDDRRPSKFIVLADNMKAAIKMGLGA
jgi:hypothetical protein